LTLVRILKNALLSARRAVVDNLSRRSEITGAMNPFGDQTLLADRVSEDEIVRVLNESGTSFMIVTEERGLIDSGRQPEYLAIVDPVDGSANLERGIPLCSGGISIVPFSERMTTDDIEVSVIKSYFTNETYVAQRGRGLQRNGKPVRVATPKPLAQAVISYDTKAPWRDDFASGSRRVIASAKDMRRSGSNLLDLCWTACGALDAMADLRRVLPIVHVSGTHMVVEGQGYVVDMLGERLRLPIDMQQRMAFVAASSKDLALEVVRLFLKHDLSSA